MLMPINFKQWIDEHRHLLKPPVANQVVYKDSDYIIMVVGGPNTRDDYHVNQGEEFFYQLEGDMELGVIVDQQRQTIPIRAGEIFLLPKLMPHQPRRPANSVGLVIEKQRAEDELDGFQWYCDQCGHKLYEEFLHVHDIVAQLPPVFARFYDNEQHTLCAQCGVRKLKKA